MPVVTNLSFSDICEAIRLLPVVAIDTETNGEDVRDGRGFAVGVSVSGRLPGVGLFSAYFPFRHGSGNNLSHVELAQLRDAIAHAQSVVFHNAKFDLVSLATLGIHVSCRVYDTMLMAHLLDENRPFSKSLDACCAYYLKDAGKKKSELFEGYIKTFGWGNVPVELMTEYAANDAEITFRLFEILKEKFDKEGLTDEYWPHKEQFIRVINDMEGLGVRVDTDLCKRMIVHGEIAMDEIVEIFGLNPGSPGDQYEIFCRRLNLPVLKRGKPSKAFPEGRPSFDKSVIERYEEMLEGSDSPDAQYVLSYRGWQKSVTSNYRPYIELLSPDGRLRPNYKLHGTKTGRMSCEKPNLQQIPRVSDKPWNGVMKKAFIPEDGYSLWEFDYSQLEFRLATAYGQEKKLMEIFADPNRDVFSEMSGDLGMARQQTKTLTYTIQYGGGNNRVSEVFKVPRWEAQEIRDNFFRTYPGFRRVSNLAERAARTRGSCKLWSGRSRHFMYPADEAHKAFNSVIQGGAADIVERSMIRVHNKIHCNDARMLLQVHDSVLMEIKHGLEEEVIPEVVGLMANVEPDFGVRFAVDAHRWGE